MNRPSCYTDADRARALQELGNSFADSIARNSGPRTEEEKKRVVTVDDNTDWQHSLLDDQENDDLIHIDPYAGDPPSKLKDNALAHILSILDSLEERGNG